MGMAEGGLVTGVAELEQERQMQWRAVVRQMREDAQRIVASSIAADEKLGRGWRWPKCAENGPRLVDGPLVDGWGPYSGRRWAPKRSLVMIDDAGTARVAVVDAEGSVAWEPLHESEPSPLTVEDKFRQNQYERWEAGEIDGGNFYS